MKVVVVSDTHMPAPGYRLPDELVQNMKDADCILHAGDIVEKDFFDELGNYGDVRAVHGNMDCGQLVKQLPEKRIEEFEGIRIGVIHGFGSPQGIQQRVQTKFSSEDKLDVLVFGHSHIAHEKRQNGLLLFNPGSPTDKMFAGFRSFGVFHINNGKLETELVRCSE